MDDMQATGERQRADIDVPVVVVGGSMVGLATAMFLAQHGVECSDREAPRHGDPSPGGVLPAAHERTDAGGGDRGPCACGIAGAVRPRRRHEQRRVPVRARDRQLHPQHQCRRGGLQPGATAVDAAAGAGADPARAGRELGAASCTRTRWSTSQQDDAGVSTRIRHVDDGTEQPIRAHYLVACDGNRSPIRERLGIAMSGHGLLSRSVTIYFRADCSRRSAVATSASSTSPIRRCAASSAWRRPGSAASWWCSRSATSTPPAPASSPTASPTRRRSSWSARRSATRIARRPHRGGRQVDRRRRQRLRPTSRPRLPRRRRRPHDAADRWLRRQHRHPRRPQLGMEVGASAERCRRPGAARDVQRRAPTVRRSGGRAGLQPVRDAQRSRPRHRRHADGDPRHARRVQSLPLDGGHPRSDFVDDGRPDIDPRAVEGLPGTRPRTSSWCETASRSRRSISTWATSCSWPDRTAGVAEAAARRRRSGSTSRHRIGHDLLDRARRPLLRAVRHRRQGAVLVRPDGYVAWRSQDASGVSELDGVLAQVLALAG